MTLQEKRVARKYARAFLSIFGEKLTENDLKRLEECCLFYQEHPHKFFYFYASSLAPALKGELVMRVCVSFGLTIVRPLVMLLAQHGRLVLLSNVLRQIVALYKEQHNIIDARFISAYPLSSEEKCGAKFFVEHVTGKKVQPHLIVDPRLIAGIRIETATLLWERSIDQQLREIWLSGKGIYGY